MLLKDVHSSHIVSLEQAFSERTTAVAVRVGGVLHNRDELEIHPTSRLPILSGLKIGGKDNAGPRQFSRGRRA
jgi:hypothetical protein